MLSPGLILSPSRWRLAAHLLAVLLLASAAGCEADGSATDEPAEVAGCDGATLLENPAPDQPGPWPVGARTVTLSGLTVEVLYPAKRGSEAGRTRRAYDLRSWLPEAERAKATEAVLQQCACYGDLPIDDAHGPYPAIVFIHGTAGFRTQSLQHMQHWASRGFIVLAADHPRIMLPDALQLRLGADQPGDARKLLQALAVGDPALAFLGDRVALGQLAVSGHSAGGMACKALGDVPGLRVAIPMAAEGIDPALPVTSTLVLGGIDDATVPFDRTRKGYEATKGTKRLVGLAGAGHLAFSDLCAIAGDAGDLFSLAKSWGITIPPGTDALFEKLATDGCKPGQLAPEEGWAAVNHATAAVLEETLHCRSSAAGDPLATLTQAHPSVTVYETAP